MDTNPISILGEKIELIESVLLKEKQEDCPVKHIFGDGIYIREVTLPAGVIAIGHHQNFPQMNVMIKGVVDIVCDDGSIMTLDATDRPISLMWGAGRKKGYIHQTVIWQNIYPNPENERSVMALEDKFLTKSDAFNEHTEDLKMIGFDDNEDYQNALIDIGVTQEIVTIETENTEDQIDFPFGEYKCCVYPSNISGFGLFATSEISEGEIIAPARIDGKRTPAGRYTNHAKFPNSEMVAIDKDIYLVSKKKISGCKGGDIGEEITIDYRNANKVRNLCQV